jgi:Cys-rich four helix bundle protein (predicted Tat secretion target)
MLLGTAAVALAAAGNMAFAEGHDHQHMHHGMKNQGLIDATFYCVQKGQACIRHCLELLGQGDKEMAACAISVNQMLAVCTSLGQLAGYESKHLAKMAKVAMDVCRECEDECRKHAKKHQECADCADACAACLKECKQIAV